MFYTVFQETGYCDGYDDAKTFVDQCDPENAEPFRFCSNWRTFLGVYTMLLGEVDGADFETSTFGLFLFVIFVFLVVILLANVLIALVTDSYSVIRNQRAAIEFCRNRLDFIVEMDVIRTGIFTRFGIGKDENNSSKDVIHASTSNSHASALWKSILDVFDKDLNRMQIWSVAFLCLTLVRIAIIFMVIPMWIVLGILTAGCIWPIQWRKKIWEQKVTTRSNSSLAKTEHQIHELIVLKDDIVDLRQEVATKLAQNQEMVVQLKSDLASLKTDVTSELRDIRQVLSTLFEAQRSLVHSPTVNI